MKLLPLVAVNLLLAGAAGAAVQSRVVEYRHGDTVLEGFMAFDDAVTGPRPAVLVVHQWMGLTDYERGRAKQLAGLGYLAFAVDVYGKGVRPETTADAGALAGTFKTDRALLRARLAAALETVRAEPLADRRRVAAIGYCFGGTGVLELARSGADLAGVVSFHGGLDSPTPADGRNIRARVLVLHGADDPWVPATDIAAFQDELRKAGVDWQMVYYSGAVHAFTQPEAGNDPGRGAAYHERSDRRSWAAMRAFFDELFAR